MKKHGFIRVAACVPETAVADVPVNAQRIIDMIRESCEKGAGIAVFPELSLTGYTCADLFDQKILTDQALIFLAKIADKTKNIGITSIVGLPLRHEDQLFNTACVIAEGKIIGAAVKTYIPEYSEYYEKRWFSSADKITDDEIDLFDYRVPIGNDLVFKNTYFEDLEFSAEICEDLWAPIPPSTHCAMGGSTLIFNLSASNELVGKAGYRRSLVQDHSGRTVSGYVYVSAGIGESSTDTVYGGHSIISEYGQVLAESERFCTEPVITFAEIDTQRLRHDRIRISSFMEYKDLKKTRKISYNSPVKENKDFLRIIDPHPFIPSDKKTLNQRCEEIFNIQTSGLYKRMKHTELKKAVIGVSGGLDSTLALLVTEKTFDKLGLPKSDMIALTMPGFGTSGDTYDNAVELINRVGANKKDISVIDACMKHFENIGHDPDMHDTVFENVQARERTMLLMNIANKEKGLVIGTGDLSEIALGWSTYNGDHMSMYAVNCGVPKTLVRFLIEWISENEVDDSTKKLLKKIIATPISPELLPPDEEGNIAQRTEEVIGPYELHDFFLYHMMRFGSLPSKILFLANEAFKDSYTSGELEKWLKVFYTRFFRSQYKRSCIPDGPKVGTVALSPRADLRMPSDAEVSIWLNEI